MNSITGTLTPVATINGTLAKDDVLVVRARARSTSYYCGVSNLVIIEQ